MFRHLLIVALLLAAGCAPTPAEPKPWTHLNFNNDPEEFQFAIVGDRTGKHRPGVFEKGIAKLNLLRPEFVMSVGDLIEGYTKDEAEIDEQWNEIESFVAKLEAPFFFVPGNHDMANGVQAKKWRERFGPAYYHFVYRDVLFLCINTYDPESVLSPAQIEYFAKALKENVKVRWTCVFLHEPLWDYEKKETGWTELENLLLDRPYTVFAGHYHQYTKYVRHDRRYLVLATTGGGWKKGLEGPELGAFDHITWVTMLPDGPRVANVGLDAIYDEDVRTEAMANVINLVLTGNLLQITPVLVTEDSFERATATLSLKNDADVAVKLAGTLPPQGPLRAVPERFDVTVMAKSTAAVNVQLRADKPTATSEVSPMTVRWTATYQLPDGKTVRVPREDWLAVERIAYAHPRGKSVVVDGKLDEWGDLPFGGKSDAGESDCSYRFGVEHDDQNVYIAIKTTDDVAVLNPLKEPWSQDGVEVRFDARPDPLRSQGRGRGEFKEILVISLSPGETPDKMVLYNAKELPPGVKAVCVKTSTGHTSEIAIPTSYLNERQGTAWKSFRMNIAVNDFDNVRGPLKALWWRPDWRSAETFAGSGTFERAAK